MKELRKWRDYLIVQLAANRGEAIDYIQFALEEYQVDRDIAVFWLSLRTFVESQCGISELAKRTHMSPDALQKILSSDKAPHLDTLCTILNALDCRLSVVPLEVEEIDMASASDIQSSSAAG